MLKLLKGGSFLEFCLCGTSYWSRSGRSTGGSLVFGEDPGISTQHGSRAGLPGEDPISKVGTSVTEVPCWNTAPRQHRFPQCVTRYRTLGAKPSSSSSVFSLSLNSLRKCPPPTPRILNFGQQSVVDPGVFPELKRVVSSPGTNWTTNVVQFGGFPFDLADSSPISAQFGGVF